jgi:hypothetical protein
MLAICPTLGQNRCIGNTAEFSEEGIMEAVTKKANVKQYGKAVADVLEVAEQYGMEVTIVDRAAELGTDIEYHIIEVKHECQVLTIRSYRAEGETQRHIKSSIYRWGRTYQLYSRNLLDAVRTMSSIKAGAQ